MLIYTCLSATESQMREGFNTVVAVESTREVIAGFKYAQDASDFCDEKNRAATPKKAIKVESELLAGQRAEIVKAA
jgi:hypothetical protein